MFTVTVELLTGRYVATQFNDRSEPEWPPHPARLFSAAVAAWADHGDFDDAERAALEWWECLEPPRIRCSLGQYELAQRSAVTHFVPVNDVSVVARDTSGTYDKLVEAEHAVLGAAADDKHRAKAVRRLEKIRTKADGDSQKATTGVAPLDRVAILPQMRPKQGRWYPTIVPADPTVDYLWLDSRDGSRHGIEQHLEVLSGLLGRIPRLGHSSSPVMVTVARSGEESEQKIALEPGSAARTLGLRVTSPGQLAELRRTFEASQRATEPRTMPARLVPYRRPEHSVDHPRSMIGERWVVLEPDRTSRLMVRDIPAVAKTLRRALMSIAGDQGAEIPEFLSGHRPRGAGETGPTEPSTAPHLMVLGLPFAAHRHATGEVMGIALALPPSGDEADAANWQVLTETVRQFVDDRGGRLSFDGTRRPIRFVFTKAAELPYSADLSRWTGPATTWTTVTPVALDRNPGRLGHADGAKRDAAASNAERIIATACERIGLPRPAGVTISLDPFIRGTRPVHAFPPARTGRLTRVQVHARIRFDQPVRGPVALGAGRFHGLGLFAPLNPVRERALGGTP